ncbi:unnamed protein product [Closterium sp. NIES-53]
MDHSLALDPTALTVDLLEQHLLAAENSVIAVGAARFTPRTPFFEGCYPSPLAPSYTSAAGAHVPGAVDVGAASASVKRCSSKGKGGRGGGRGSGGGGGGSSGRWCGLWRWWQRWEWWQEWELWWRQWRQRSGVAIFDLDFYAILAAMYALSAIAEGDSYLCVLPDPGIEAAALGASESVLPGTAPAEALHTFTLDSGASCCFFRNSTTLTPLSAPVPARLADPSRGPVLACSFTVLVCPAVPSGSLSGLHLPSFSTNLVSTATLEDAMVTTTAPGGQHVLIFMCTRTGRHLATFTCWPGSSLYTLATEPPQVAAFAQVSASGQVESPCSCRLLSHQTLMWHHHLGHPSVPRLRGMHSRLLVSGLPTSLPPLPPSPAPPCLPCVKGRQRAAPHSSSLPPTTAPLQTLHMDVWGPARVSGQGGKRYFLLVVDDFTCSASGSVRTMGSGSCMDNDVLVYFDDLIFATADTEALTLVLQCFGFQFSSPQPTPLSTGHSLSAPPSNKSVEPSVLYPELVGCLKYLMTTLGMWLMLGGRGPVVLTGHVDASWVDDSATQRSSQGYTFSLGSCSNSWRSTRSSSVLSSNCEAQIYTGAMAAQELR